VREQPLRKGGPSKRPARRAEGHTSEGEAARRRERVEGAALVKGPETLLEFIFFL